MKGLELFLQTFDAPATFLLDNYPKMSGFSFRRLSSSTVHCCRLRDSLSNERDFTPEELTDGTLQSFAGANTAFCIKFYEQNSSGIVTQETTGGSGPGTNIVYDGTNLLLDNGRLALGDFSGGGLVSHINNNLITSQTLIVVCHKFINSGDIRHSIGNNISFEGMVTNGTFGSVNTGVITSTGVNYMPTEVLRQGVFVYDSNAGNFRVDGVNEITGITGTVAWETIGFRNFSGIRINDDFLFQEFLWSNDNQTANIPTIEADIKSYYNIP